MLDTWNDTQAPYPHDKCIHQLFEAQVDQDPEATALVYQDQTLSYAQLNGQANRLAHHLIALGVKPDDRVAICLERSPAMVVGLLAILKAGGAYVPLDPAHPSARLTQILQDAQPALLLADAAGQQALGPDALQTLTVIHLMISAGNEPLISDFIADLRRAMSVKDLVRAPMLAYGDGEPYLQGS